ncbi:MAG: MFS transporter [Planctomycetota bacterium]
MPGLLTLLVPATPPDCRDALTRDVQFTATRALIKGATIALGVQLCLHMGGTATHAAWMHTASFIGLLASLFYAQLGRDRSPLALLFAAETTACLLLVSVGTLWMLGPQSALPTVFAVLVGLSVATSSLGAPMQSTVYAYVYPEAVRGRLISFTRLTQGVVSILGLTLLGLMVRELPGSEWLIYPVAGMLGLWSVRRFCAMRLPDRALVKPTGRGGAFSFLRVLHTDRAYARYQFFQFILGIANLTGIPMIAVFARDELHLGVDVAVFVVAGGVVEQTAVMLTVRMHGWLYDRIGVLWHRVVTSSLILCAYLVWSVADNVVTAGFACALAGLGLAGGQIIWLIGSLHFAPRGEESYYASVHSFLTGLRGLIAPLLGLFLLQEVFAHSYRAFFLCCSALIAVSIVGHALFVRVPPRPATSDRLAPAV